MKTIAIMVATLIISLFAITAPVYAWEVVQQGDTIIINNVEPGQEIIINQKTDTSENSEIPEDTNEQSTTNEPEKNQSVGEYFSENPLHLAMLILFSLFCMTITYEIIRLWREGDETFVYFLFPAIVSLTGVILMFLDLFKLL